MAVKDVVKVMNFHSLLRVDKARRKAAMYFDTETELLKVIKKILLNKNIILDKKMIAPDPHNPKLNVYIGNDLGFCGDFNSLINREIKNDDAFKIVIGKKIHTDKDSKVIFSQAKKDFFDDFSQVQNIIYEAIISNKYSEINVIYNHYHNINKLEFTKKRLYPVDYDDREENLDEYTDDFATETNIQTMITNLLALYICYELKICEMNGYAAENVVRQQITKESLKKIDEMEEEKMKASRKIKKQKDFQKIVENYRGGN